MSRLKRIRREPGSVVSWYPAHDAYYIVAGMRSAAAGIGTLHVTQSALATLESRLARDRSAVPFGLLVGALCVNPQSKQEYLLIDEIVPSRHELSTVDPLRELEDELHTLITAPERGDKLVIGWYLGGMDGDLGLDSDLEAVHRKLFSEKWQVVLVRGTQSGAQHGAFFRFEMMTERFYVIPFFESVPGSSRRGQPVDLRTGVQWVNYRSEQPVTPVDVLAVPEPAVGASPRSKRQDFQLRGWLGAFRRERNGAPPEASARVRHAALESATASTAQPAATIRVPAPSPPVPKARETDDVPVRSKLHTAPMALPAPTVEHVVSEPASQVQPVGSPEPDAPRVFINGILVPLPEADVPIASDRPIPGSRLRTVLLAVLVLVMLLIAVASYFMTR